MASHTTTAGKGETAKQAEKRLSITVCELVRCMGDLRQAVHFFEQRICAAVAGLPTRRDLDKLGKLCQQQNNKTAILKRIAEMEGKIMSAISQFAEKQAAFNDKIDAAVTGLTEDIEALNDKIEELQNTAGEITAEDQALLDAIETRSDAIATKLAALDALTPPKPPVG